MLFLRRFEIVLTSSPQSRTISLKPRTRSSIAWSSIATSRLAKRPPLPPTPRRRTQPQATAQPSSPSAHLSSSNLMSSLAISGTSWRPVHSRRRHCSRMEVLSQKISCLLGTSALMDQESSSTRVQLVAMVQTMEMGRHRCRTGQAMVRRMVLREICGWLHSLSLPALRFCREGTLPRSSANQLRL